MDGRGDPYISVVSAFYEAATHPELFPDALDTVRRLVEADTAYSCVMVADLPPETLAYREVGGPELIGVYESQFASEDPWVQGLMRCGVGMPHLSDEMIPSKALQRTSFYQDFLRPNYNILHSMGMVAPFGRDSAIMLGFHRTANHDCFEIEHKERLYAVSGHIGRAMHLFRRYREWTATELLLNALDKVQTALVIVDALGCVAFLNAAAADFLARFNGVAIRHNRLIASDSLAAEALQHAITRALSDDVDPTVRLSIHIPVVELARGLVASVFPLAARLRDQCHADRAALIALIEPTVRVAHSLKEALALIGLSPAESRLAALLAQGIRLELAADQLSISRNTARNHLASIFAKTGTNRQSDLRTLLASLTRP